jgi:hypothetical protein
MIRCCGAVIVKSGLTEILASEPLLQRKSLSSPDFCDVTKRMARIAEDRNRLLAYAFGFLEVHHGLLAQVLVQMTGNRAAAARWMCARNKAFGGLTAYDLIGEGDVDRVWDSIQI